MANKTTDAGLINPIVFNPSMLVSSTAAANTEPIWALGTYAIEDKVISPITHRIYECVAAHVGVLNDVSAEVSISIAVAAVVAWPAHGLAAGSEVVFSTAGTLPTGVTAGARYYVLSPTPDEFNLAASIGGAPITTTGIQSGKHKANVKSTQPSNSIEGDDAKWTDLGAINLHAMFDEKWGTQTKANGSLTVVIAPGIVIDSLALLNVKGSRVEIISRVNGVVKTEKSISLTSNLGIDDWKKFFLIPPVAKRDVIVNDLLPYGTQEITITVTGPGEVAIGNISMGMYVTLGQLQWRPKVGAVRYAQDTTDRWGNITIGKGNIVKRFSGTLEVDTEFADQLQAIFMNVLDVPIVLAGAGSMFSSLIGWGLVQDFEIDISYKNLSYCSFSFKGFV